jgi:hypothetical protein
MSRVAPNPSMATSNTKRVCVFTGSRHGQRPAYADCARRLGKEMARQGVGLVYGGEGPDCPPRLNCCTELGHNHLLCPLVACRRHSWSYGRDSQDGG